MFWCQHQKFKNRKKLAPLYGEGTVFKDPHQLVKPLAIDISLVIKNFKRYHSKSILCFTRLPSLIRAINEGGEAEELTKYNCSITIDIMLRIMYG